jgi:transposase
LRRI